MPRARQEPSCTAGVLGLGVLFPVQYHWGNFFKSVKFVMIHTDLGCVPGKFWAREEVGTALRASEYGGDEDMAWVLLAALPADGEGP